MVTGHLEEVRANGIQPVVTSEPFVRVERFQQLQTGPGTLNHRRRDRMVERHHGVLGHAFEQAVQREYLRPIGVLGPHRFVVKRCNRRLQLIGAHRAARQRFADEGHAFRDRLAVPPQAILFRQRDQLAFGSRARIAAGIGQQHQGEETGDFSLGRQQMVQRARQSNRFVGQVGAQQIAAAAAGVSLVEDQIEHVQNAVEAFRALSIAWKPERFTGRLDTLLRAADALRHRRFGHEKRVGDLGSRQPTDRAQRERDRR